MLLSRVIWPQILRADRHMTLPGSAGATGVIGTAAPGCTGRGVVATAIDPALLSPQARPFPGCRVPPMNQHDIRGRRLAEAARNQGE